MGVGERGQGRICYGGSKVRLRWVCRGWTEKGEKRVRKRGGGLFVSCKGF